MAIQPIDVDVPKSAFQFKISIVRTIKRFLPSKWRAPQMSDVHVTYMYVRVRSDHIS